MVQLNNMVFHLWCSNIIGENTIYRGKYMKNENISYVAVGLSLGVSFGLVFDNLALGISIGLVVGIGLDSKKKNQKKK